MMGSFELDGTCYQVDLVAFERQFAPALTENNGTAADGTFYYEDKGVTRSVKVQLRARPGCEGQLEQLWEDLRSGGIRHCILPGSFGKAEMYVYVKSCAQTLLNTRLSLRWDSIRAELEVVMEGDSADGA